MRVTLTINVNLLPLKHKSPVYDSDELPSSVTPDCWSQENTHHHSIYKFCLADAEIYKSLLNHKIIEFV